MTCSDCCCAASRLTVLLLTVGVTWQATSRLSKAASFSFVSSRAALGANDSVDWGQLGADDTFAANPSSVTSALGAAFSVSKTQSDRFLRANEGGLIYHGDMPPGDHLITTNDGNNDPNVIVLGQGQFLAAGAQIEADAQGAFTARITAYDSMGGVLASFTANGSTNPNGPGTGFAPFMGIESLDNTTFAPSVSTSYRPEGTRPLLQSMQSVSDKSPSLPR